MIMYLSKSHAVVQCGKMDASARLVLLRSLFKTRFFSLIKYQLSNHCFVFSSSPKSAAKRGTCKHQPHSQDSQFQMEKPWEQGWVMSIVQKGFI